MALPLYLAMTAAEMQVNPSLPKHFAYMACHFSPYGTGLSGAPHSLPDGSLLILNDLIPLHGHDTQQIIQQLNGIVKANGCSGVLLDFQRPEVDESHKLAAAIVDALPCPAAVSDIYANDLCCPVFLPPVPLDVPLAKYIAPWQGRDIWIEAALDSLCFCVREQGCQTQLCSAGEFPFHDNKLHCRYRIELNGDSALFSLNRNAADLAALLEDAASLGVTQAVGLWQELN